MQVYKGLDIVTNKITHAEKQGEIEPDFDFTAEEFCLNSIVYIETILKTQCVPIIVGGSNSYIEKLVEDHVFMFKYKYDNVDYTKGIRRSIGVPEMASYLREEKNIDRDAESKKMILQVSISSIKRNTHILICNQVDKIQ
ncbi:hypothetical protein H5410_001356 [Solanum commersonii]|uniref:Isopentenyltransferase n=1 Tax=Solanum commersonii TaxID=4109 RepID=A0A9J6AZW7_SOLCO|nr:hypothetical protein H5410_001356 [Solanum commersonii]